MQGTPQQPPGPGVPRPPGPPQPGQAPSGEQGLQPGAAQPPDPRQEVDALRAWVDDVDRRLKVRTYAGMVIAVLALAAGIVALILAMQAKDDSATKSEVQDVREQVATLEESAGQVTDEDLDAVTERVSTLEDRIGTLTDDRSSTEQQISVIEDDIQDLRDQIADLESGAGSAATPEAPGGSGEETP
jgi:polyhydroxyalkanoate synthesis regulator phasin